MQQREKRRRVRVDGLVLEPARVEPLHEVFEGVGAVGGEVDGVGGGFEEAVGAVQGGGEVGGVAAQEFPVHGEGLEGGADGDGDGCFEERAVGGGGLVLAGGREVGTMALCHVGWGTGRDRTHRRGEATASSLLASGSSMVL